MRSTWHGMTEMRELVRHRVLCWRSAELCLEWHFQAPVYLSRFYVDFSLSLSMCRTRLCLTFAFFSFKDPLKRLYLAFMCIRSRQSIECRRSESLLPMMRRNEWNGMMLKPWDQQEYLRHCRRVPTQSETTANRYGI